MRKKLSLLAGFLIAGISFSNAQGLPTTPDPGKCYVKCITKDEFKEVTETIETYPAYTSLEVQPATYKTIEETVVVKEATKKFVYVPAVYETVEVPYTKAEGRNDLEVVPATFGTSSRTFEVYPATSGWEYKVLEDCPSVNKEDCMAACFVEYPAQFKDVTFTTLANNATTRQIPVSAQEGVYKKRVVKTPAKVEEIEIPAEYQTIKRRVVETPAKAIQTSIPAKTSTVTKTVLVKKGGMTTWEEVNCELLDPNLLPIFYELGSARLTRESLTVIDEKLLPIMADSNVNVEIMSHTDSRGNDDFNQSLSQQRANSVVNYLVSKGIDRSRLSAKGYGETRLTNRCSNGVQCTEDQHQRNRRTEFRVLNQN